MLLRYLFLLLLMIPLSLLAVDEYVLNIKDHHFVPDKLIVPANQKIKLIINNQDEEIEEFESFDLHREKIIPSKGQIKVNIAPLEAGEYKFFGDFHSETAQGIIIVE